MSSRASACSSVISESIDEVLTTLMEAIVLVIIVMFLFLQDWRSTIIPTLAIPVSLVGTFAFVQAFGFSINTLTLFGITLATGLVVDDAIVVIENIHRHVHDYGKSPRPGRKLGHVTALGSDLAEVRARAVAAARYLADGVVDEAFAFEQEH